MGRYKQLRIRGLLIHDFDKIFIDGFNNAIKSSGHNEEEVLKKVGPKFNKILSDYEEFMSTFYLEKHKFSLDAFLKAHSGNQRKIAKFHGNSFEAFVLYINVCFGIYEKIIERLRRKRVDSTLKMTVALYGLIIRRADEIISLLLNGYIDGAMIIWRSLYENAIILLVLATENDNELTDRYVQHSVKSAGRKIRSYNQQRREFKFPALPRSTELKLQKAVDNMNNKYGKEFLENDYGWANKLFKGKPNFYRLEERVEMGRFRPYYILCSEQIHSNLNSFSRFMDK